MDLVAEVTEVAFTPFARPKKADHFSARMVVRRIPDFSAENNKQQATHTLFDRGG